MLIIDNDTDEVVGVELERFGKQDTVWHVSELTPAERGVIERKLGHDFVSVTVLDSRSEILRHSNLACLTRRAGRSGISGQCYHHFLDDLYFVRYKYLRGDIDFREAVGHFSLAGYTGDRSGLANFLRNLSVIDTVHKYVDINFRQMILGLTMLRPDAPRVRAGFAGSQLTAERLLYYASRSYLLSPVLTDTDSRMRAIFTLGLYGESESDCSDCFVSRELRSVFEADYEGRVSSLGWFYVSEFEFGGVYDFVGFHEVPMFGRRDGDIIYIYGDIIRVNLLTLDTQS